MLNHHLLSTVKFILFICLLAYLLFIYYYVQYNLYVMIDCWIIMILRYFLNICYCSAFNYYPIYLFKFLFTIYSIFYNSSFYLYLYFLSIDLFYSSYLIYKFLFIILFYFKYFSKFNDLYSFLFLIFCT